MKKSFVFAMAMALGVTASAYAANPFSDVPEGHWAYGSIQKLAAAGVVDGYGDSTFGGDKLMTRYEMAQIVAKAMAKGANVDKLAAEFADELDTLGVRVANLEKKVDNVKITGQIRTHYKDADAATKSHAAVMRTRLFVKGAINSDWTYTGRIQNVQTISNEKGDDELSLNWAFVSGKLGGTNVDAGRMDFSFADVMDQRGEGVKLSYGKDIKLTGWAFKAASNKWGKGVNTVASEDRAYVLGLGGKLGAVNADARYYKFDNAGDQKILEIALSGKIAKDLTLRGSYFNGSRINDDALDSSGWLVGLAYKGAKAANVGSWGMFANYSERPMSTFVDPTCFAGYAEYPAATFSGGDGYEGYEVGVNYVLAKNMVAGVKYFDFDSREGNTDAQTIWSELVITF